MIVDTIHRGKEAPAVAIKKKSTCGVLCIINVDNMHREKGARGLYKKATTRSTDN